MLNQLRKAEERFSEIESALENPEIASDKDKFRDLMKEYKSLSPLMEEYRSYQKHLSALEEAEAIIADPNSDRELKQLAEEELFQLRELCEQDTERLKIMLLDKDPNDDKNVVIEIRGGAGGEEAALFASVLYRMYCMYAESVGFRVEVMNVSRTELGGCKEAVFMVIGEGAFSRLKFESGVHRVQRVPETETQGRIHTSTATVAVLPEAEDVEIEINGLLTYDRKVLKYNPAVLRKAHADVMRRVIRDVVPENIPVIFAADFGHVFPMVTFPIGGRVRVEAGERAVITLLEH